MSGVAVLGCGLIGVRRAQVLPPPFAIRAVYDVDVSRAEALARRLAPEALVAESPADALSGEIDLAIVATPHAHLVPLARMAVAAGCHVFIEKPGGRSGSELRLLREEAASRGSLVRVGYNHRFHPSVVRARELVRSGAYGGVMGIRGRYGHGGRPGYELEWRASRQASGGGELLDQGVHLIDLVRHLTGDVSLAFAELRTDYWRCDVEDNAYVGLRLHHGGFAWLHASWTEWKNLFSLEIALQRAKIEIAGLGGSYGVERMTLYEMPPELGPPHTTSWEWPFPDRSWDREIEDVAAQIAARTHQAVGAGLDDAIAVLDVVDEAYGRPTASDTTGAVSGKDML